MKILHSLQGKRIEDNAHPANPGEYSYFSQETPGAWWPGKPYWMICTPRGTLGNLVNHKCIMEEDGTLTVPSPKPGEGPNSILVESNWDGKTWHGFMDHGYFKELG